MASSPDCTAQSTAERTRTHFIMSETKVRSFADLHLGKKDYYKVHCIKKKSVTCGQQSSAITSSASCTKGAAFEASRSKTLSNMSANLGKSRFKHLTTKKPTEDEANHDLINRIDIDPSVIDPSVIDGDGHDVTKKSTAHHDMRSHSPACSATSKCVKNSATAVLPSPNSPRGDRGQMEGGANNDALSISAFVAKAEDGRKERRMQENHHTTRQRKPPALIVIAAGATRDKDAAVAAHISNQECDKNYSETLRDAAAAYARTPPDTRVAEMENSLENENCSIDGQTLLSISPEIDDKIFLQNICGRAENSRHGTAGIEANVFLFDSLWTAKEETMSCNDGASFLSNRSKENLVSILH